MEQLKKQQAELYPQLLQRLIGKSSLLYYFDAYHIDLLQSKEERKWMFFIHSPHASAATLLQDFFNTNIGLDVDTAIVERTQSDGTPSYGVEIAFSDVESNAAALEYIAAHYVEHCRLMGLLQHCTSISGLRMRQNAFYISARTEVCAQFALLEGVQYCQNYDTSPVVSSFDTVRISIIMLHHNAAMLEELLATNLPAPAYRSLATI